MKSKIDIQKLSEVENILFIKRDIARFYLTGKTTLSSIRDHYNLKQHAVNKILDEVLMEVQEKKINSLF